MLWFMQKLSDSHGNHSIHWEISFLSLQIRKEIPNFPTCHLINMQCADLVTPFFSPDGFLSLYFNFSLTRTFSPNTLQNAFCIENWEQWTVLCFRLLHRLLYTKLNVDSSHAFTFPKWPKSDLVNKWNDALFGCGEWISHQIQNGIEVDKW